jgi:hypothetical protein
VRTQTVRTVLPLSYDQADVIRQLKTPDAKIAPSVVQAMADSAPWPSASLLNVKPSCSVATLSRPYLRQAGAQNYAQDSTFASDSWQ